MTIIAACSRFTRKYILCPEVFIVLIILVVLYNSLAHVRPFLTLVQNARTNFQTKFAGRYEGVDDSSNEKLQSQTQQNESESTKASSWELKKENVAIFAIQGRRPHMEDRFNLVNNLENTNTSIYGIFDGHGGEFAAEFAEKTLFKSLMMRLLQSKISSVKENLTQIITQEILNVDSQLLGLAKENMDISGTTALLALLKDGILAVANVGDSRGVICDKDGKAIPISVDHKPQQLKERMRIKQAGGFISFNGVWRVAGVLATSRALGDYPLKDKNYIVATPDIQFFDLNELQPDFVILATDGLWDCFSNEEAVAYVRDRLDEPHYGAKSLVLQAYYRGSLDNITVMVVNFKMLQAQWKKNR